MTRRVLDWTVLLAVLGVGGYWVYAHHAQVQTAVQLVRSQVAPCSSPVTYSLGSIDPRFGIATSTFIADMKEAASIWAQSGKTLLQYEPEGGAVTVSLVYDARQAATDQLKAAGIQVDQSKATYDSLKRRYDALSAQVDAEQAAYDERVATYKSDESAYNTAVGQWNAQGGAPPDVYTQMQQQQQALQSEYSSVKSQESALNADISMLNALATTINQLIVQLNLNVQQYNRTGTAQGEFEEGVYVLADGAQTINIYEFSGHVELVRVLAHEMGHALGLQHVADPQAIMYHLNSGTNLTLAKADLAELDSACHFASQ